MTERSRKQSWKGGCKGEVEYWRGDDVEYGAVQDVSYSHHFETHVNIGL